MEQHLSWCKGFAQVQIQEHITALFNNKINPEGWLCRHDQNCDRNFATAGLFIQLFQKRQKQKSEHPISLDRKVVWVVSGATGDLCNMMPALWTGSKNSNITLQSWLIGFLLFFWKRFLKYIVFNKIQLVVYHQCCVLIGWATSRLYVIAH